MKDKVGILTWHYYFNFGSSLQAFALQKLIEGLGYDVSIINYRDPRLDKRVWWKDIARRVLRNTIGLLSPRIRSKYSVPNALRFQERYLRQTNRFERPESLPFWIRGYRSLVYGADQIWAPNVYKPIYMGAYVPDGVRKVSYAASVGLNHIPDELADTYCPSNPDSYKLLFDVLDEVIEVFEPDVIQITEKHPNRGAFCFIFSFSACLSEVSAAGRRTRGEDLFPALFLR